jgi:hypothetical protein
MLLMKVAIEVALALITGAKEGVIVGLEEGATVGLEDEAMVGDKVDGVGTDGASRAEGVSLFRKPNTSASTIPISTRITRETMTIRSSLGKALVRISAVCSFVRM